MQIRTHLSAGHRTTPGGSDERNMGSNRALDILRVVVLSGAVRPSEVELLCLSVCNVCRETSADYSVAVSTQNVDPLLRSRQGEKEARLFSSGHSHGSGSSNNKILSSALPAHTPGPTRKCSSRITPHRRIGSLAFRVDLPLSQVVWPEGLRVLKFGWAFNHPLDRPLPHALVDLNLGGTFNYHIEDVVWPAQLVKLRFGDRFNRQIELATWPATLESLSFGSSFDQPIESTEWPEALKTLSLGDAFNHPIRSAKWANLNNFQILEFGIAFRCPVQGVLWPSMLRELKFGACFDQPIDLWDLPRSLRLLQVPDVYSFDTPLGWPPGCELLVDRTDMFTGVFDA